MAIYKHRGYTIAVGSAIGRAVGNNGRELDKAAHELDKTAPPVVGAVHWLWVDGGYEPCSLVRLDGESSELLTSAGRTIYRPTSMLS